MAKETPQDAIKGPDKHHTERQGGRSIRTVHRPEDDQPGAAIIEKNST